MSAASLPTAPAPTPHSSIVDRSHPVASPLCLLPLLSARRVRHKSDLGAQGPWQYEVGDAIQPFNPSKDIIAESSLNVPRLNPPSAHPPTLPSF